MAPDERHARWKSNYAHISVHTAQMWADHFITELNETCKKAIKHNTLQPVSIAPEVVASAFAHVEKRLIVIGYNTAMTVSGAAATSSAHGRFDRLPHIKKNKQRCA